MQTGTRAYRNAATVAGAIFLVIASIFLVQVFIAALGKRVVPPIHAPYKLSADFTDALGVRVGQQVLVNGAVVGQVQGVDLQDGHAHVRMEFDPDKGPVHQAVTVHITPTSSVGHPVVVNPDDALRRVAREEGWEIMLFDRLRRRLRIASLAGAAGLLAAGTGFAAARMTRPTGLRARLGLA